MVTIFSLKAQKDTTLEVIPLMWHIYCFQWVYDMQLCLKTLTLGLVHHGNTLKSCVLRSSRLAFELKNGIIENNLLSFPSGNFFFIFHFKSNCILNLIVYY